MLSPPTNDKIKIDDSNNVESLKHLESMFNELAMAYYSDKKSLEQCIHTYQDKYHKADYMQNMLFDNLNISLNVSFFLFFTSMSTFTVFIFEENFTNS